MEENKEQVLNELYALRAGLSVISKEYDKMLNIKINCLKEVIAIGSKAESYYTCIIKDSYFPSMKPHWEHFIGIILSHNFDWYNILMDIYGEEFKQSDSFVVRDNFFRKEFNSYEHKNIGLEYEIKLHKKLNPYQDQDKSFGDYFTENGCSCTKCAMERYLLVQWLKSEYMDESLKAKIAFQRGKLFGGKKLLAELEQMQGNLPSLRREIVEAESEATNSLQEAKDGAVILYNALQTEFNHFLDIRDWKYLDFIIYYFETRRADTVKEALQFVDKEMQTQRIEQLIVAATQQICNTLAIGFNMLQNTIINCYNALSAQIAQSSSAISTQIHADAAYLCNALKAKANVPSEQIMNEVKHILNM